MRIVSLVYNPRNSHSSFYMPFLWPMLCNQRLCMLIGLLSVHNNVLLRSAVGRLPAHPSHTLSLSMKRDSRTISVRCGTPLMLLPRASSLALPKFSNHLQLQILSPHLLLFSSLRGYTCTALSRQSKFLLYFSSLDFSQHISTLGSHIFSEDPNQQCPH